MVAAMLREIGLAATLPRIVTNMRASVSCSRSDFLHFRLGDFPPSRFHDSAETAKAKFCPPLAGLTPGSRSDDKRATQDIPIRLPLSLRHRRRHADVVMGGAAAFRVSKTRCVVHLYD